MPPTGGIIAGTLGALAAAAAAIRAGKVVGPFIKTAGQAIINKVKNAGKVPDSDIRQSGKITRTPFKDRLGLIGSKLKRDLLQKIRGVPKPQLTIEQENLAIQTAQNLKPNIIRSDVAGTMVIGGIKGLGKKQFKRVAKKLRQSTISFQERVLKLSRSADNPEAVKGLAVRIKQAFSRGEKTIALSRLASLNAKDTKALQAVFGLNMGGAKIDAIKRALRVKFKL